MRGSSRVCVHTETVLMHCTCKHNVLGSAPMPPGHPCRFPYCFSQCSLTTAVKHLSFELFRGILPLRAWPCRLHGNHCLSLIQGSVAGQSALDVCTSSRGHSLSLINVRTLAPRSLENLFSGLSLVVAACPFSQLTSWSQEARRSALKP